MYICTSYCRILTETEVMALEVCGFWSPQHQFQLSKADFVIIYI